MTDTKTPMKRFNAIRWPTPTRVLVGADRHQMPEAGETIMITGEPYTVVSATMVPQMEICVEPAGKKP